VCDPNARDEAGFTALHLCAKANQRAAAVLLLGAGAQLGAKDGRGRTPLSLARSVSYAGDTATLLADATQARRPQRSILTPVPRGGEGSSDAVARVGGGRLPLLSFCCLMYIYTSLQLLCLLLLVCSFFSHFFF
jgi:hypothetical protein